MGRRQGVNAGVCSASLLGLGLGDGGCPSLRLECKVILDVYVAVGSSSFADCQRTWQMQSCSQWISGSFWSGIERDRNDSDECIKSRRNFAVEAGQIDFVAFGALDRECITKGITGRITVVRVGREWTRDILCDPSEDQKWFELYQG